MRIFSLSRKKILFILVTGIFVLVFNMFPNQSRGVVYSVSAPVQSWVFGIGQGVAGFFNRFQATDSIKENILLRTENMQLRQELITLESARKENEQFRQALDLEVSSSLSLIAGEAVAKDVSGNILFVNKGKKQGIEKDFPVITAQKVLVGRVINVFEETSHVQLLWHPETSFDASLVKEGFVGVVKGKGSSQLLLDLVEQGVELVPGDIVATSTLSGLFPENLLVGEVIEILTTDQAAFQQARVQPYFHIGAYAPLFFVIQ
jgi:rod shape-determining protein MreC